MAQPRKKPTKKNRSKHTPPKAIFSFRRHVVPPLIGLFVMLSAYVVLNSQMLVAQANYHFKKPVPMTVGRAVSTKSPDPAAEPQILIPSLDAKAPIVFEDNTADWAVQLALQKGVDHYGNTANPGQIGNAVIFGHSSGQLWTPGDYKFIFTMLDRVKVGEPIIIDYQGTRYTYKVTGSEIILPTNLSVLNQSVHKPTLTLITCSPVGTNKYRLVVHADQISPNPAVAIKPAVTSSVRAQPQLPSSAHSSFWQSLTSWL